MNERSDMRTQVPHVSARLAPLFLVTAGGTLYYCLEVTVRGWSHWSMAVCGGICLFGIYYMNRALEDFPLLLRAVLGALLITAVELAAGGVVNLALGWQVWDYSAHPFHLWGQICLYASLRWVILCIPVCLGCSALRRYVFEV